MITRPAKHDDAASIARIRAETWRATYRGIIPDDYLDGLSASIEEKGATLRSAILDKGRTEYFYVAEEDDNVVGFVICGPGRDGDGRYGGEIYAIYVLPAYQHRGIGHMLMKAAIAKLQELGFVSMLTWTPDNNPYCRFYERLGGARVARKKYEIGGAWIDLVAYGWENISRIPYLS